MTIKQSIQQKIIGFFLRYPKVFVRMVSEFYAFEPMEIRKYFGRLDIRWLSSNIYCHWDSATINQFRDQIDWPLFSLNCKAFGEVQLIDEFITDIVWTDFDSRDHEQCITYNEAIPWSENFISKYENFIDFDQLSWNQRVPWTVDLIEKYFERWDWDGLSANDNFPWSEETISKYADLFDWEAIIFFNDNFPWSLSIAKKYRHKLVEMDYELLMGNGVLWSQMEIVDEFADFVNWQEIASNHCLPWHTENLRERWKDHLGGISFENNSAFFPNPHFFEDHIDKYLENDGNLLKELSDSSELPWSISFVERFREYWDWSSMSMNKRLPWSLDFVDQYLKYWVWGNSKRNEEGWMSGSSGLLGNEGIPWDIDWILRYEQFINVDAMSYEEMIWEKSFKPHLDQKTIDTIFRLI